MASDLATYLAAHNVPVIGGLSKGVEGYAHTAVIKAGGSTLAFLAHGLDKLGCSLVAGNAYSRESQDTNTLIAEGAQIYLEPAQLLDGLPRLSWPAPQQAKLIGQGSLLQETPAAKGDSPTQETKLPYVWF